MMDEHGKSDRFVVPKNSPNNVPERTAEAKEGRERTKGNTPERNASRTQGRLDAQRAVVAVLNAVYETDLDRFDVA